MLLMCTTLAILIMDVMPRMICAGRSAARRFLITCSASPACASAWRRTRRATGVCKLPTSEQRLVGPRTAVGSVRGKGRGGYGAPCAVRDLLWRRTTCIARYR